MFTVNVAEKGIENTRSDPRDGDLVHFFWKNTDGSVSFDLANYDEQNFGAGLTSEKIFEVGAPVDCRCTVYIELKIQNDENM